MNIEIRRYTPSFAALLFLSGCVSAAAYSNSNEGGNSPAETQLFIDDCVAGNSLIEECGEPLDYETDILPELDKIFTMVSFSTDISPHAKERLVNILQTVGNMQSQGLINWYKLKANATHGYNMGFLLTKASNVIIPQVGSESERHEVLIHEIIHAIQVYNAQPGVEQLPYLPSEYEADFYSNLVGWLTRQDQSVSDKDKEVIGRQMKSSFGIDMPQAVAYLDKLGMDESSRVFQYLYNLKIRYWLRGQINMYTEAAKDAGNGDMSWTLFINIDDFEQQIENIKNDWGDFRLQQATPEELVIINAMINQEWTSEDFFPDQPPAQSLVPGRRGEELAFLRGQNHDLRKIIF